EALQHGPIGRVQDDDLIEIVIDRGEALAGTINLVGIKGERCSPEECARVLAVRDPHLSLRAHESLPDDTRLWAALQRASGGTWAGCVYDVDRIEALLEAGARATAHARGDDAAASASDASALAGAER
ncbi:MAG TPA: hypothetical protein VF488_04530, partial [Gemmatimonadaceae bacterium]